MIVILLAALCVVYDTLYMIHCIHGKRYGAAVGMVALIALVAAGTIALQIK